MPWSKYLDTFKIHPVKIESGVYIEGNGYGNSDSENKYTIKKKIYINRFKLKSKKILKKSGRF